jgi:hypothetical protein
MSVLVQDANEENEFTELEKKCRHHLNEIITYEYYDSSNRDWMSKLKSGCSLCMLKLMLLKDLKGIEKWQTKSQLETMLKVM